MKKTDKYRFIEKRGIGRGVDYHPWIETHELSPRSWTVKLLGWKTRRIHQLLSLHGELYYFLLVQWEDDVIDIREQYPLLPIERTLIIANELGIKHPTIKNKFGKVEDVVMTTDFVITKNKDGIIYDIARDVKMSQKLNNRRTNDKFKIVKKYWEMENIDWGVVTEHEIPQMIGYNLLNMYQDFFWAEQMNIEENLRLRLIFKFKDMLVQNNFDIYKTTENFDIINGWREGESLKFFKYLILNKKILTDLNNRLDFESMEIWLPNE